mgnify:CR=1 FL=1
MSLSGKTVKGSYKDVLQMDNSNSGVDTSTRIIKDGEGTDTALRLSDDVVIIRPVNDNTTAAFSVADQGGTSLLVVDSSNSKVSALGNYLNTQYAHFGIANDVSDSWLAGAHHPVPFSATMGAVTNDQTSFGTGTDPATTFTTADSNDERASDIVRYCWYLPDAISIDAIVSLEGADNATGDTTRFHAFSYDFTSGATSCLTNGTLLAHNSDTTNAGSEQPYSSSWTIDSAAVAAGKVILAFFESDSVNSDYSLNITVKYHLT